MKGSMDAGLARHVVECGYAVEWSFGEKKEALIRHMSVEKEIGLGEKIFHYVLTHVKELYG